MAGLAASRNTAELAEDKERFYPVEANTNVYLGGMVGFDANGYVAPMSAAAGLKIIGRAEQMYNETYPGQNPLNNPGAAGSVSVKVRRGVFLLDNAAGGAAILQQHIGGVAYSTDDHTVGNSDAGGTLSACGRIVDIDISGGIWVDTRLPFAIAT